MTGELVPISEMEEHMRISLIDPKWAPLPPAAGVGLTLLPRAGSCQGLPGARHCRAPGPPLR
jgi:hypothetical protein